MSLQACADIVAKGDPDRYLAAMAGPVEARRVLLPLYAFNVEVARAPWVASEPMIGEMRLQWWRDALEEIGSGSPVRKHEVTVPLADVLDAAGARLLDRGVAARRWDLYRDPFEDMAHFNDYLDRTGGTLMWVAARALGSRPEAEDVVRRYGAAAALARFLQAVPELEARGRVPLVDGRTEAVAELAGTALARMPRRRALREAVPAAARSALTEGWQTRAVLKQAWKEPGRVSAGALGLSEFRKRWMLLLSRL